MKISVLLLCLLVTVSASARTKRPKLFRAIVYTETGVRTGGILYELTDSTLRYVRNTSEAIAQFRAGQVPEVFEVHARTIEKIVLRRKGHAGRSVLIGGGAGTLAGAALIAAARSGSDFVFGYLPGVVAMTIVTGFQWGAIASIFPRKMKRLNRNAAAFAEFRRELLPFSYRFQENSRLQPQKPFAN